MRTSGDGSDTSRLLEGCWTLASSGTRIGGGKQPRKRSASSDERGCVVLALCLVSRSDDLINSACWI